METFLYTLLGILVGGVITYFVSKFYYKKSVKTKSLGVFVHFITDILSDIDPAVKKKLSVSYETQEVDKLYQMQFIIANNGDLPVNDIIEPLTLEIPRNGIVLDVNIIHVEPEGRTITYEINSNETTHFVKFIFPLLNGGEYFVVKLLIKGELPKPSSLRRNRRANLSEHEIKALESFNIYSHYKFTITADDLPPKILSEKLPYDYLESEIKTGRDFSSFIAAIVVFIIAASMAYVLYCLKDFYPNLYTWHFKTFFSSFSFVYIPIFLTWLVAIVLLIASFAIAWSGVGDFRPKKKPKFTLPSRLKNHRIFKPWDL